MDINRTNKIAATEEGPWLLSSYGVLHSWIRNLSKKIRQVLFNSFLLKDLITEVQAVRSLTAQREVGVGVGWHSHSRERGVDRKKILGVLHFSRRRWGQEPKGRVRGDSIPHPCNRALREWIQSSQCILSCVPAGMWTVNLSHHPSSHWPANNPCTFHLLPNHLFFSFYLHNFSILIPSSLPSHGAPRSSSKCFHVTSFSPSYETHNSIMSSQYGFIYLLNKYYWAHTMSQVLFQLLRMQQ